MIGSIDEEWSILRPNYVIKDKTGSSVLQIEGPICQCKCCYDVDFKAFNCVTF